MQVTFTNTQFYIENRGGEVNLYKVHNLLILIIKQYIFEGKYQEFLNRVCNVQGVDYLSDVTVG